MIVKEEMGNIEEGEKLSIEISRILKSEIRARMVFSADSKLKSYGEYSISSTLSTAHQCAAME